MSLIKGLHHVSMTCCSESEYNEEIAFYRDVLEIPVLRSWDGGVMLNAGNAVIEIFPNGDEHLEKGTIRHFSLATDDVDECIRRVRQAGYPVFVEPKDIVIQTTPGFTARIAFCKGPLGEEIEFFQEKIS